MSDTTTKEVKLWEVIVYGFFGSIAILAAIIYGIMGICASIQKYNVWSAGQDGQAELQKADWNRQIIVREAEAKEQAAVSLAQAERKLAEHRKWLEDKLNGLNNSLGKRVSIIKPIQRECYKLALNNLDAGDSNK